MKIYFDSCIFQSLKSKEDHDLLELIISGKGEYQYFFSEAHLQELARDESGEKHDDLMFMERIVEDNCLCFEERELYKNITPTNLYQHLDWLAGGDLEHADMLSDATSVAMSEIKGCDGAVIKDKTRFMESLSNLINQSERNQMEKYLDLYNLFDQLKIFPFGHQKNQFINLINKGKHSFFGRNCEIVVSNDQDFIRKSSFIYDLFDIDTIVLTMEEFDGFLKEQVQGQTDVVDSLIAQIAKETVNNSRFLKNQESGNLYFVEKLSRKYLGYFDEIIRSKEGDVFVTKNFDHSHFKRPLLKEMEHCANRLYARFGSDINSIEKFDPMSVDAWADKTWILSDGELQITLLYNQKVYLVLGKVFKMKGDLDK